MSNPPFDYPADTDREIVANTDREASVCLLVQRAVEEEEAGEVEERGMRDGRSDWLGGTAKAKWCRERGGEGNWAGWGVPCTSVLAPERPQ